MLASVVHVQTSTDSRDALGCHSMHPQKGTGLHMRSAPPSFLWSVEFKMLLLARTFLLSGVKLPCRHFGAETIGQASHPTHI